MFAREKGWVMDKKDKVECDIQAYRYEISNYGNKSYFMGNIINNIIITFYGDRW